MLRIYMKIILLFVINALKGSSNAKYTNKRTSRIFWAKKPRMEAKCTGSAHWSAIGYPTSMAHIKISPVCNKNKSKFS